MDRNHVFINRNKLIETLYTPMLIWLIEWRKSAQIHKIEKKLNLNLNNNTIVYKIG